MQARGEKNRAKRNRKAYRAGFVSICTLALIFSPSLVLAQHGGHSAPPARPHFSRPPQPRVQQPRPQSRPSSPPRVTQPQFQPRNLNQNQGANQVRPGHLPEWLNRHQNLTPQQQEDALRREPGFKNLPQDQQQRLVNRLHNLDSKSPEERQRLVQRNERFEQLSPRQKQEVRGAAQAFRQMPTDRQTAMRRAFQDLRAVPPDQRDSVLNSARFQQEFTPQERTVLGNLLSIEPYQPRAGAPQQ